jgi:hypothetical protein
MLRNYIEYLFLYLKLSRDLGVRFTLHFFDPITRLAYASEKLPLEHGELMGSEMICGSWNGFGNVNSLQLTIVLGMINFMW